MRMARDAERSEGNGGQPLAEAAALASALACLHALRTTAPLPHFPIVSAATVSRFIMTKEVRGLVWDLQALDTYLQSLSAMRHDASQGERTNTCQQGGALVAGAARPGTEQDRYRPRELQPLTVGRLLLCQANKAILTDVHRVLKAVNKSLTSTELAPFANHVLVCLAGEFWRLLV